MIAWFAKLPLMKKIGWSVLAVIFMGSALVLCYAGILEWPNLRAIDNVKDRVGLELDIIKTVASILGGLFFLGTLYFTWANLVETRGKNQADLKMAQEKQITDLYVKAIEQLGGKTLEVRLGGIYALERIARDSEKDHGPIMEVLTAYVRANAPWPPEDFTEAREKQPWAKERPGGQTKKEGGSAPGKGEAEEPAEKIPKLDADIQAVLTVIGRRSPTFGKGESQPLDLSETDLREAYLWGAHLDGAFLWGAHLEGATLIEAHLEVALLAGAHLEGAFLDQAHLNQAHLERADLRLAHLEGAFLKEAHLQGADLSTAMGLIQAKINEAYCDEETKLPLGLKCSGKKEPQP